MKVEFYILRNKHTGAWMPEVKAGYTWEEFTQAKPPRLFTTARGASNALTYWLRGNYRLKTSTIDTWDGPDVEVTEQTFPVPSRGVREDYEIVPVEIRRAKAAR